MLEQAGIDFVPAASGLRVETAQVIEELIQMAEKFREAAQCGESPGLNIDELSFDDALATDEAVVRELGELGDATLKKIAVELTQNLRKSWSGPQMLHQFLFQGD